MWSFPTHWFASHTRHITRNYYRFDLLVHLDLTNQEQGTSTLHRWSQRLWCLFWEYTERKFLFHPSQAFTETMQDTRCERSLQAPSRTLVAFFVKWLQRIVITSQTFLCLVTRWWLWRMHNQAIQGSHHRYRLSEICLEFETHILRHLVSNYITYYTRRWYLECKCLDWKHICADAHEEEVSAWLKWWSFTWISTLRNI